MTEKYKKLAPHEVVQVMNMLSETVEKAGDGYARYRDGWSDARIAQQLAVNPSAVANLRARYHGKLKVAQTDQSRRIEDLETQVLQLMEENQRMRLWSNSINEWMRYIRRELEMHRPDRVKSFQDLPKLFEGRH